MPFYGQRITCSDQKNLVLWQRFNKMPDHAHFSMPDISGVTDNYDGRALISLAILKAIQIVDMQETGREEEAFSEWLRYIDFYFKLFTTPSTMPEKAGFLILVAIQTDALEALLYNDPSLAKRHGDAITKTLDIQSLKAFRLDRMIADDWSFFEAFILSGVGPSPLHKRQLYSCFKEEQKRTDMIAKEYFQSGEKLSHCRALYPNDVGSLMKTSFIQPGNPISNIIDNLLITGIIKGKEIVTSTQHQIIAYRMIKAAITMLQQNIKSSEVQTFLDYAPVDMQNPITESPFLWDRQEKKIYYKNPDHPELESRYGFYVNVRDDF